MDNQESLRVFDNPFPSYVWPHILNIALKYPSSAPILMATCRLFAEKVPECPRFKELSQREQRSAIIEARLKLKGLKLRKDSTLCKDYIEHGLVSVAWRRFSVALWVPACSLVAY